MSQERAECTMSIFEKMNCKKIDKIYEKTSNWKLQLGLKDGGRDLTN